MIISHAASLKKRVPIKLGLVDGNDLNHNIYTHKCVYKTVVLSVVGNRSSIIPPNLKCRQNPQGGELRFPTTDRTTVLYTHLCVYMLWFKSFPSTSPSLMDTLFF